MLLFAIALMMTSATLPPELARVLTDYETAWRNKDDAALAVLFDEDGFVLPGGSPPVRGRDAIRAYYKGHGGPLVLRPLASSTEGTTGFIIGTYAREQDGPDIGKFTLTLRKDANGHWLIVSDMDNSNSRPRCSTAAAAVGAASQRLIANDNAKNLEGVLGGYTDDVVWVPPNSPAVTGKAALRPRYEQLFSSNAIDLSSEIVEARADGGLGYVRGYTSGTVKPLDGSAAISVDDQFVALVRCVDGDWRVSHLIWSPRRR